MSTIERHHPLAQAILSEFPAAVRVHAGETVTDRERVLDVDCVEDADGNFFYDFCGPALEAIRRSWSRLDPGPWDVNLDPSADNEWVLDFAKEG